MPYLQGAWRVTGQELWKSTQFKCELETEASLCATPVNCGGVQYKWHKQEASFGMRARGYRHSQLGMFRLRAKAARLSSKGCTRADPQLWMSKGLGCAWASPAAAASEKRTKAALAPGLPCHAHRGAGTCTVECLWPWCRSTGQELLTLPSSWEMWGFPWSEPGAAGWLRTILSGTSRVEKGQISNPKYLKHKECVRDFLPWEFPDHLICATTWYLADWHVAH